MPCGSKTNIKCTVVGRPAFNSIGLIPTPQTVENRDCYWQWHWLLLGNGNYRLLISNLKHFIPLDLNYYSIKIGTIFTLFEL